LPPRLAYVRCCDESSVVHASGLCHICAGTIGRRTARRDSAYRTLAMRRAAVRPVVDNMVVSVDAAPTLLTAIDLGDGLGS
jgi:hypothetical protein